MTESGFHMSNITPGEPPEEFISSVRDALAHLYDIAYLQSHPFAPAGAAGAQQLKRMLMETMEALNPGSSVYFRAPQARPYNMLLLHYIERMTIQKAASELGISERQAYRELRDGETSVARLLWARFAEKQQDPASRAPDEEAAGLRGKKTTNLGDLLEGAVATVQRLASQSGVRLHIDLQSSPAVREADQAAARQILVSLLSRVIQAAAGDICIRSWQNQGKTFLTINFISKTGSGGEGLPIDPITQELLQQVGLVINQESGESGQQRIELHMESGSQTIVLIDDDEGFAGLLKRYLNGLPFRLVPAHSGIEGIEIVRVTRPALVLLDVMMPGLDGWETLQRLQTDPETLDIPLIICSVFNDPELARSLGAQQLLPKPVSREEFLAALETIGVL